MISTLQVPAAAPSGSSSTVAVTFTSSSISSSEALYGASGSIEVTNVMISAMRRELSKLVSCYQTSENTAAARAECAEMAVHAFLSESISSQQMGPVGGAR